MKKFKFNVTALILSIITVTCFTSCDEGGEPDPGGTRTEKFAGDWYITGYNPDLTNAFGGGYILYSTYNAASNDENFWIDDHGAFFEIKTKVQVTDFNARTFAGPTDAPELITGGTVTVTNGKIFKNGGMTTGGHVVDSIYFEAEFDWEPGTIFRFGGHKRTGFLEDEH